MNRSTLRAVSADGSRVAMRLFSLCPRIKKKNERIIVSTGWRVRLLTLGLQIRRLTIDPARKKILVEDRNAWWFRKRRVISFSSIEAVTYDYEDTAFGAGWSWSHDAIDWYRVGLRFYDGTELHLFSFVGEGSFVNSGPLPDWMYWDETLFDVTGSQEDESRLFVNALAKLSNATVGPSRGY